MKSIPQRVTERFGALVNAGRGEWGSGVAGELGAVLYKFDDPSRGTGLLVCEKGFSHQHAGQSADRRYDAIKDLDDLLVLADIVAISRDRDPGRLVQFKVLMADGAATSIHLPFFIYAAFCPFLYRAIDPELSELKP